MMEMLIAVSILVILMALGFIAVMNYQRGMKQLELDRTAQEIYVAAQNHLTQADAEGVLKQRLTSEAKGEEAPRGKTTYHYFFVSPHDGRLTSKSDTVLYDMLPAYSLEDTVRTGGSYVIEYDLDSATVTNVFYSDQSDLSKVRFTSSDRESLFATGENAGYWGNDSENPGAPKRRLDGFNEESNMIIGWYGGEDAKGLKKTNLYTPKIEIINAERLEAKVSIPASAISRMTRNFDPLLQVFIQGVESGDNGKQLVNADVASGNKLGETLQYFLTTSTLEIKGGVGYRTKTYVLDDVTKRDDHFCNKWCSDATYSLIPGEDVKVMALIRSTTIVDGTIANQAKSGWSDPTNSLYGNLVVDSTTSKATANIANFRHLENLDPKISNYQYSTTLKEAVQDNDMTWQDFLSKTNGASTQVYQFDKNAETSKAGTYMPVVPQKTTQKTEPRIKLEKYEGNNHTITGVVVDNAANAGLFGSVDGATIQNLKLLDFNIKTSNGSAGTLAGSISGTTVTNVHAYNSQSDDGSKEIVASGAAGGLVGSVTGTTDEDNPLALTGNAAAVYVRSTDGSAGGLLGSTSQNVKVDNSYAGGHTKDGMYLSDRVEGSEERKVGRINVQAKTESGGLIGNADGRLTVNDSYATTSVYGATTAGGFVGKISAGGITNCYATGLVTGIEENFGTFAGSAVSGVTFTKDTYYSIVNPGVLAVSKNESTDGITAFDADTAAYKAYIKDHTLPEPAATPYDATLATRYNNGYPLKTIKELTSGAVTTNIASTHVGDWPAMDTLVVNARTSSQD